MDEVATTVDSSPALSMTTLQRSAPSTKGLSNYTTSLNIVTFQPQARDVAPDKLLKVLLGFGEHARELISSEVALHVLALLADREARDRQLAAAFDADEVARLQHLLECCVQMQVRALELCTRIFRLVHPRTEPACGSLSTILRLRRPRPWFASPSARCRGVAQTHC